MLIYFLNFVSAFIAISGIVVFFFDSTVSFLPV